MSGGNHTSGFVGRRELTRTPPLTRSRLSESSQQLRSPLTPKRKVKSHKTSTALPNTMTSVSTSIANFVSGTGAVSKTSGIVTTSASNPAVNIENGVSGVSQMLPSCRSPNSQENALNNSMINNLSSQNNVPFSQTPLNIFQPDSNPPFSYNAPVINNTENTDRFITKTQLEAMLEARESSLLMKFRDLIANPTVSKQSSTVSSQNSVVFPNNNTTLTSSIPGCLVTNQVSGAGSSNISGQVNSALNFSSSTNPQINTSSVAGFGSIIPTPQFASDNQQWLPYQPQSSLAQPLAGSQNGLNPYMQNTRNNFEFYSFFKDDPIQWFAQLEDQFLWHGIVADEPKFNIVMRNLGVDIVRQIAAELRVVTVGNKYLTLKDVLIRKFSDTPQALSLIHISEPTRPY